MLVGIIADSHDNLPRINQAVDFFNRVQVAVVVHAGDIIAPFALQRFAQLACKFIAVFGNNDGEKEGLRQVGKGFAAALHEPPHRLRLGERSILLVHDSEGIVPEERRNCDIFVCGHTHAPQLQQADNKLTVNPGECGGWLSGTATIATVDTESLNGHIHVLA